MSQDDKTVLRSSSAMAEALRRTVAASALGVLAAASTATAHAPDPIMKDGHSEVVSNAQMPTIGEKAAANAAFDLRLTPIQLVGCSIGHTSHSQFTCN